MRPSSAPSGWSSSGSVRRHVQVVALAGCLAVLGACGQGTQSALPGTPSASSATHDKDTPTSTAEVDVPREGVEPALVTGVRYAAHDTYDRLVVDLEGGIPGYNVKWVDQFVEDGSGKPMDVHAGAYLLLTLFPANAHDEEGEPTWGDGLIYQADLGNLTSVVRTGDFEGRVGIGLALAKKAPFQVKELDNRLILDVAH
ncbi:hypothetical protein ITP53_06445 [Nonomuraea sp. K274]|uniref:AMIN-like domain-containing protein n=1 Tax=Nonomuraea cypriaca TaxID=1187855 RepID=A0A931A352_9ACTN|nr:hypothetical protein [Nonomuraea cypriaca]MBF8185382.1 hypothetical protein [Nonomuraea cypriaca]